MAFRLSHVMLAILAISAWQEVHGLRRVKKKDMPQPHAEITEAKDVDKIVALGTSLGRTPESMLNVTELDEEGGQVLLSRDATPTKAVQVKCVPKKEWTVIGAIVGLIVGIGSAVLIECACSGKPVGGEIPAEDGDQARPRAPTYGPTWDAASASIWFPDSLPGHWSAPSTPHGSGTSEALGLPQRKARRILCLKFFVVLMLGVLCAGIGGALGFLLGYRSERTVTFQCLSGTRAPHHGLDCSLASGQQEACIPILETPNGTPSAAATTTTAATTRISTLTTTTRMTVATTTAMITTSTTTTRTTVATTTTTTRTTTSTTATRTRTTTTRKTTAMSTTTRTMTVRTEANSRPQELGHYDALEDVTVTYTSDLGSSVVAELKAGAAFNVIKLEEVDHVIRAEIEHPHGWISLSDASVASRKASCGNDSACSDRRCSLREGECLPINPALDFALGDYDANKDLEVSSQIYTSSKQVGKLRIGSGALVLSIQYVVSEDKVRAEIARPHGWVTLLDTSVGANPTATLTHRESYCRAMRSFERCKGHFIKCYWDGDASVDGGCRGVSITTTTTTTTTHVDQSSFSGEDSDIVDRLDDKELNEEMESFGRQIDSLMAPLSEMRRNLAAVKEATSNKGIEKMMSDVDSIGEEFFDIHESVPDLDKEVPTSMAQTSTRPESALSRVLKKQQAAKKDL